jgi:2,3-dihydroxybenzoate-AMP ligase
MHELIRQSDPDVSRATVDALQATLDPDSTAVYQLSGGTTGVPKVIAHPQPAYSALARHWAANLDWDSDIVSATFLPVMHNAGLATALLPALLSGGSAVICRSADPAGLADVIARHRVNWLHFSMAAYRPLLDYAAHHDCDFSSVTHFTWTLIRPEMSARAEELLGAVAVGSCGMGEGILLSARRDDSPRVRRETVGAPIGPLDRVRVFRPDTEEEAADGELGELIFSGPTVVRSYLCPAEANSTGFTSDGALRSGDLGRAVVIDGRRCFTMEGRLKDQIVRGGEKFMAEELEVLLTAHPSIREVAVVGVPDARLGERVGVFVVCNPGKHDPGREELVAFLRDRGVAKFKWPEQVVHVDALPKSGIGKVQKTVLRRQLTA